MWVSDTGVPNSAGEGSKTEGTRGFLVSREAQEQENSQHTQETQRRYNSVSSTGQGEEALSTHTTAEGTDLDYKCWQPKCSTTVFRKSTKR